MNAGGASACHVIVTGAVQGVGFRYSARAAAARLRLTGYVRNLADGSVEVVCEGPSSAVESFLRWLAVGPPGAVVKHVDRRPLAARGLYRGFTIDH